MKYEFHIPCVFHLNSNYIVPFINFLPLFDHEQLNNTSRNLEVQMGLSICGGKLKADY